MSIGIVATVEDLYRVDGKAELVNGEVREMHATGDVPGRAGDAVLVSLRQHEKTIPGKAYGDSKGFLCDLPHRKSFSPDAAFYTGPASGMKFMPIPPVFAAEVRSENDYGPAAEREMAEKRDDYFATGVTKVVWDVDMLSDDVVCVYRANDPTTPTIYRQGETAEAEPAVPGWTMLVDELFD